MRVEPISHRGFWLTPEEQNTEVAFRRSFAAGFGIETDLQFRSGEIVIAHDVDQPAHMTFEYMLGLYTAYQNRPALALNVKADGLQDHVQSVLSRYDVDNYFMFDMSVPELLRYRAKSMRYFTRVSEYETEAVCIEDADGVWLDQFQGDWIDQAAVNHWSSGAKRLCVVSPELHRRDPATSWARYKAMSNPNPEIAVLLCTDFPAQAQDYFS